jgi:hypothetical protein
MARTANSGRVWVHPSEAIEVRGEMKNGHVLKIYIGKDQARLLQAALNMADQTKSGHLGHAFWHATNPEMPFPCEYKGSCELKEEAENENA